MAKQQLAFHWPLPANYRPEDFITSASNEQAQQKLAAWPQAGEVGCLLLTGPVGSGKTHLANIWAARMGARLLEVQALGTAPSEDIWGEGACAVLENLDEVRDEKALFHLLRFVETTQRCLLLTSRALPRDLPLGLPDVKSRLSATQMIAIEAPDDTLLAALLAKGFADRQWKVATRVIDYIVPRTERSCAAIQKLLLKLEENVATNNSEITTAVVKPLVE